MVVAATEPIEVLKSFHTRVIYFVRGKRGLFVNEVIAFKN